MSRDEDATHVGTKAPCSGGRPFYIFAILIFAASYLPHDWLNNYQAPFAIMFCAAWLTGVVEDLIVRRSMLGTIWGKSAK